MGCNGPRMGAGDLGWGAKDLYSALKGAVDLDGADSVDLLHGSVELYCTDRCSTSTVNSALAVLSAYSRTPV